MLFLQFKINDNRYILEARDIIEIVPYANLKRISKAPGYVAGLLNYRGDSVPIIDLSFLMSDKTSKEKLSTRIVLINYKKDERVICLGLLIEHLTETVRYDEKDFSDSGVTLEGSPYLGRVVIEDHSIIQLVDFKKIIPEEAHDMLFQGNHSE